MIKLKLFLYLMVSGTMLAASIAKAQLNNESRPVEFLNFTVCPDPNGAHLNWATSSETNLAGFELEKNYNGGSWSTVKFVKGHETSKVKNEYEIIDKSLDVDGKYYYRLKIIDINKNVTYSSMLILTLKRSIHFSTFRIYPNPFKDKISVQFTDGYEGKMSWNVNDASGKTLLSDQSIVKSKQSIDLNLNSLAPGLYFLYITKENSTEVIKIVKE